VNGNVGTRWMIALALTVIAVAACNTANASNGAAPDGSVSAAQAPSASQNSAAARTADSVPHGGIGEPAVATQTP
jgi:hypothetical protein